MAPMKQDLHNSAYQFRNLLASVVAGNIPVEELAKKLIPYIYDKEGEYEQYLWKEQQLYRLNQDLKDCKGIQIVAVTLNSSEEKDYNMTATIIYESTSCFLAYHERVHNIVQKLINELNKKCKIMQRIDDEFIRAGKEVNEVAIIASPYVVEIEV